MPKVRCVNKECSKYEEEIFIYRLKTILNDNTGEMVNKANCSECGGVLKSIPLANNENHKGVHFIGRDNKRYYKS